MYQANKLFSDFCIQSIDPATANTVADQIFAQMVRQSRMYGWETGLYQLRL